MNRTPVSTVSGWYSAIKLQAFMGLLGIEPKSRASKARMLPLHHNPIGETRRTCTSYFPASGEYVPCYAIVSYRASWILTSVSRFKASCPWTLDDSPLVLTERFALSFTGSKPVALILLSYASLCSQCDSNTRDQCEKLVSLSI